jgi:hypothetical protein
MRNLILMFLFSFVNLVSFSQIYTFDVKNYDLYTIKGFSEKDSIIKNIKQFESKVSDKHYVLNLDKKVAFVSENGVEENFVISDVLTNGNESEFIIESSVDGGAITMFSIYLTFNNNDISHICLFWFDPWNNLTIVKNVK